MIERTLTSQAFATVGHSRRAETTAAPLRASPPPYESDGSEQATPRGPNPVRRRRWQKALGLGKKRVVERD